MKKIMTLLMLGGILLSACKRDKITVVPGTIAETGTALKGTWKWMSSATKGDGAETTELKNPVTDYMEFGAEGTFKMSYTDGNPPVEHSIISTFSVPGAATFKVNDETYTITKLDANNLVFYNEFTSNGVSYRTTYTLSR